MDKVVVNGVPPWDGEYEFDGSLKNRELHRIKKITGIRAGELGEALVSGDTDILVALAVVAIERTGKTVDVDDFWNAEVGSIDYVSEEDEASPPDESSPSESLSEDSAKND